MREHINACTMVKRALGDRVPRETTTGERRSEQQRLLERIGFDGPSPLSVRKMKTEAPRIPMPQLPRPGAQSVPKKLPMKPNKFDGTGSLESFFAQFDMCAITDGLPLTAG